MNTNVVEKKMPLNLSVVYWKMLPLIHLPQIRSYLQVKLQVNKSEGSKEQKMSPANTA